MAGKAMNKSKAMLSMILIVVVGIQWLLPLHALVGVARPALAHTEHRMHGHSLLQHPCCEHGGSTLGFHGSLCCGACPTLPGAIADFCSYTPCLSFIAVEPQEKSFVFLASLWHPPTL